MGHLSEARLSEDRSSEDRFTPSPKRRCERGSAEYEDDPGFFVLFSSHAEIHRLLQNPCNRNHPTNTRAPVIPTQQAMPAQSYAAICQFLDAVALSAGMSRDNFATNALNARRAGLYHGVPGHVADAFELILDTYVWQFGPGDTMGFLYRFSPTGPARTQFTQKTSGPFV